MFTGRRVVTGLDAAGKSCLIFNGVPPVRRDVADGKDGQASLWRTSGWPVDNEGNEDATSRLISLEQRFNGSEFLLFEVPGQTSMVMKYGMHATDTIDYITIISGELTLLVERGEQLLRAGDTVVDRGVIHGWENRGVEPAFMTVVMLEALSLRRQG